MKPDISAQFDAMVRRYVEAVLDKSASDLSLLYGADIRAFDAWESWGFEGIRAWRDNLEDWLGSLASERVEVVFEDVQKQAGDNFGCLSAIVRYTAIDERGAVLRSMQNRLTWLLQRFAAGWLIVHEHTSVPISFEDTRGIMQRAPG